MKEDKIIKEKSNKNRSFIAENICFIYSWNLLIKKNYYKNFLLLNNLILILKYANKVN